MALPSEPSATSPGDPTTGILEHLSAALAGRYAIERELARGGTALVLLARDLKHGRLVALKVIRPEVGSVVGAKRFLREIQLAAKLQHANILPVHDSGDADGLLYYVMPYVDGESLRARLSREEQLPLDDALQITRDVAGALGHAHRWGIVHRDIKPENILLSGGQALVVDFGIARAVGDVSGSGAPTIERLTETGLAVGTPAYMSPEEASGSRRLDQRTDIYSLGCVLYEMLGGEPPYTGPTPQAVIAKRLAAPIPHVRALREAVPPAIERAVTRALAKAPADRFATAEEFAAALAPDAVSAASVAPEPITPTTRVLRLFRHRSRWALALAGGAIVAAAATALALRHPPAAPAAARLASPDARRLAVAVFANQTGDTSLDPLGDIVADYLARGLAETRLVEVIDARADQSPGASAHARDLAGARALARALGAGSVIWGAYSRRGDSLEVRAQLTDAVTGKPLAAILPAVGSATQQIQAVEALRQRVMTTFAAQMDPRFAPYQTASASQPISYEAYREFLAGAEISWMACAEPDDCAAETVAHYRRAYALDSTFTLPIVAVAEISGLASVGQCARTDSIADLLRPRHDRLPPFDRYRLDWAVASCHGQHAKALEAARQAVLAAPRSDLLVLRYAAFARHNGRLREAIELVERLDRARNERNGSYWGNRIIAYHLLGEHQRELELAQEARRVLPIDMEIRMWEAYALVGLGRLAEVSARVDEMARMPQTDMISQVWGLSGYMDMIGRDLRAHGHREAARAVFERGIRWIKALPPERRLQEFRLDLAGLLYDTERWDEARQILKRLSAETPDDMELRAALGAVAARLGDLREVARIDRWLAAQTRPYLNGQHTFNRARLAAILGDRDRAVQLYRQAVDEGFGFHALYGVHTDPDFESLRGYPPFEELPGRF